MKREYIPWYIRIKNDILNRIAKGELKKNDKLPTEQELSRHFGVSRITVVAALRELETEGIIVKKRGSGSYIERDVLREEDEDIFAQITPAPQTTISYGIVAAKPNYEFMLKTLAGIFRVENPDVRVNIVNLHWPDNDESDPWLLQFARGEVPTTGEFFMYSTYAALGALAPLDGFDDFDHLAKTLHPGSTYLTAGSDGVPRVHAMNIRYGTRMLMANTDFLAAAGIRDLDCAPGRERLEEWLEAASEYARKKGDGSYGYFLMEPQGWHGMVPLLQFLSQGIKDQDYAPNSLACFRKLFQDPVCLEELQFLTRIMTRMPSAPANGQELFAVGKVGIILSSTFWPLVLGEMTASPVPVRVYPIPPLPGRPRFRPVMGGSSVGIFRAGVSSPAEQEAAWRWLKFLFRRQSQYLLSMDYALPSLKGAYSLLERNYPAFYAAYLAESQYSRPQFDFRNVRDYLTGVGIELKKAFSGKIPPEECLQLIRHRLKDSYSG